MENNRDIAENSRKAISNLLNLYEQIATIGIEQFDVSDYITLDIMIASISYYYSINKDENSLKLVEYLCKDSRVNLDTRLFLYWQLVRIDFLDTSERSKIDLKQIYESIYEMFIKKIEHKDPIKKMEQNKNIAVLITNQFLGDRHAPTKILLNIIKTINDQHTEIDEVYIFNSTEMPTKSYCRYYDPYIVTYIDFTEDMLKVNIDSVQIDRCKVHYYSNQEESSTVLRISNMMDEIYSLNPSFIISVGGSNVLADLCNIFTQTYTVGTAQGIPISKSKYLVNITEEDSIKETKINDSQTFIGMPNGLYGLNRVKENYNISYTRDEFGIPKEMFLISVVGNRLHLEVTDQFIQMISSLLIKNTNTGVVMIGKFDKESIKDKVSEDVYHRIYAIGSVLNLVNAISITDMYLNPIRKGGGYSAMYALICGIPILSTDYGDVVASLTNDFKVDDYDEMFLLADKIINNVNTYSQMCNKMKAIYEKYEKRDWRILIDYILNKTM